MHEDHTEGLSSSQESHLKCLQCAYRVNRRGKKKNAINYFQLLIHFTFSPPHQTQAQSRQSLLPVLETIAFCFSFLFFEKKNIYQFVPQSWSVEPPSRGTFCYTETERWEFSLSYRKPPECLIDKGLLSLPKKKSNLKSASIEGDADTVPKRIVAVQFLGPDSCTQRSEMVERIRPEHH